MEERLQKILSRHGVASRREAEELILSGRVTVNGAEARLGMKADEDLDQILVDGDPLAQTEQRVYIMLNKPRGCLCTRKDEKGRKTVLDYLGNCRARVWPVGRLDLNSEGLLLLTDDGELTNALTHPSHGVEKVYTVRVAGEDIPGAIKLLKGTLELEDGPARAKTVRLLKDDGDRAILEITVTEGRKHLVRNMCAAAGLEVKRLIRVAEGGLALGELRTGCWRYLEAEELRALKKSAGL
jgi:23S rRNA pseudouridine2605 synthase